MSPRPSKLSDRTNVLWCGNRRGGAGTGWAFPPRVRRHLEKDCAGLSVVHLFGGQNSFGTRLDVDAIVRPDVIGDAYLPPFAKESFDVVILDPPYTTINAQVKTALFRAAGYVARHRVIWFATQWQAASGGLRADKAWLVRVGDSCQVRCLQYFTIAARPGPMKNFVRGPAMKYNKWLAGERAFDFGTGTSKQASLSTGMTSADSSSANVNPEGLACRDAESLAEKERLETTA